VRKLNFKRSPHIIKQRGQLTQNHTSKGIKPRIMAITSGKGGVGKTSIAVNLAISLAQASHKVVIFDADLGLANAEILMGISPPLTLYDCLKGRAEIKDILIPGPAGVKLVSGGSGFVELANLSDKMLQHIMDSLQVIDNEADFIIVDTAAGISKNVLAFTAAVEELVLVITPEPTSMTDAYSLAKIVSRYNLHNKINIIINRVAGTMEAAETLRRFNNVCNHFLNLKLDYLGYIPEDRSVPKAIKAQEPLLLHSTSSPATKCMIKISENILNDQQEHIKQRLGMREFANKLVRLFRR